MGHLWAVKTQRGGGGAYIEWRDFSVWKLRRQMVKSWNCARISKQFKLIIYKMWQKQFPLDVRGLVAAGCPLVNRIINRAASCALRTAEVPVWGYAGTHIWLEVCQGGKSSQVTVIACCKASFESGVTESASRSSVCPQNTKRSGQDSRTSFSRLRLHLLLGSGWWITVNWFIIIIIAANATHTRTHAHAQRNSN